MSSDANERIEFTVVTPSRHPETTDAYDPIAHTYRPDYVRPPGWQLEIKVGAAPLAEKITAYQWRVEESGGAFAYHMTYDDKVSGIDDITVEVPALGKYTISLDARLADGRQLSWQRDFHLRDFLVVAIGDSYFCGEGNPDRAGQPSPVVGPLTCNLATFTKFLIEKAHFRVPMEREARWQEARVHRSYRGGPSLAAADLQLPALGVVVTFLNFARTGSTVYEGLLGPRPEDDWTDEGQIEELKKAIGDRQIDALLISTGGNDIEFPDRLMDLMRGDLMLVGAGGPLGDDDLNRKQELEEAKEKLAELPGRLDDLADAVASLNARAVYLVEYPTAHFDKTDAQGNVIVESGCGIFDGPDMNIDGRDAQLVKESGVKLNRHLERAAQRHGWLFVDGVADAFAGHGRCAGDPFFLTAEESCRAQGDFEGTMHPNAKGHAAYGECIRAAIYQYTIAPAISIKKE